MFQQSILDSLANVGFQGLNWTGLANLGQDEISQMFASHYDLNPEDIPSSLFQKITPEMLQSASYSTYAPQIEAQGQSMLPDLYKSVGGQQASQAAGGFAGSSGFQAQQRGARDVYGKSLTDTLTNVQQQQSRGIGGISDLISQWHEAAQKIKGY